VVRRQELLGTVCFHRLFQHRSCDWQVPLLAFNFDFACILYGKIDLTLPLCPLKSSPTQVIAHSNLTAVSLLPVFYTAKGLELCQQLLFFDFACILYDKVEPATIVPL